MPFTGFKKFKEECGTKHPTDLQKMARKVFTETKDPDHDIDKTCETCKFEKNLDIRCVYCMYNNRHIDNWQPKELIKLINRLGLE